MTNPDQAIPRPFVIGVTGRIATGKSTVLQRLAALGAETIDADLVYHSMIRPGAELTGVLASAFGTHILDAEGGIDRRRLANRVFSDPAGLARLDNLTHPAVVAEIEQRISRSIARVVAVDAVKLLESGMAAHCDTVWMTVASTETQIERLIARNGFDGSEASRRVAAQPEDSAKRACVDLVIENEGSPDELRRAVDNAWLALPILPERE